jgi:hypothetical protein
MPLLGQASGGWTESSSALRILNIGIRNSTAVATDDAFTQANPVDSTTTVVTTKLNSTLVGVLSGSVCFTRPDAGTNYAGGPGTHALKVAYAAATTTLQFGYRPLGLFINNALGNPFENTPGVASGVLPYVSQMGTYGDALYETSTPVAGAAITYVNGVPLVSSVNGFLMPLYNAGVSTDTTDAAEYVVWGGTGHLTTLGILKLVPDAVENELVFDARI